MVETNLHEYKIKQYIRLGFTQYEAEKLASAKIELCGRRGARPLDVESVAGLLKAGCTTKLAYRIYRP